jgi:circadian clock protein KaiB
MPPEQNAPNRQAANVECPGSEAEGKTYVFRLYVTGMTPRSSRAISTIKAICEEHLQGRYNLEVIDIYQQPALAKAEQIIATPTLVKKLPVPLRRFIGDLSDRERVLFGLNLPRKAEMDRLPPESRPRRRQGHA